MRSIACILGPAALLAAMPESVAQVTVGYEQKVNTEEGDFDGELDQGDQFGWSVAALGDVDGDGYADVAVGARRDGDGGSVAGAVWILFPRPDGTVRAHRKISATEGGFGGALDPVDLFGYSVAALGDLDEDGRLELAVGAPGDDDAGPEAGAVWILLGQDDGAKFTLEAEER